ncbi:MAG: aryl-sulfate sulfotransferase [Nitrospiria bacterium]
MSNGFDHYQYALTELTTKTKLGIKVDSAGGYIVVNNNIFKGGAWNYIDIPDISDASVITIEDHIPGPYEGKKLIIHTLPEDFPGFTVSGKISRTGELALTPLSFAGQEKNYLLLLDEAGKIKYYQRSPDKNYFDFKKYNSNGKIRYSYIEGTDFLDGSGGEDGLAYVLDENLRILDIVDGLLPNPGKNRTEKLKTDLHEFLWIGDNHYIMAATYIKDVTDIPNMTGTELVSAAVIQGRKDSNILFEWDSSDFPVLYSESEENDNFNSSSSSDYMHINSITVDTADNNFIVSFRDQSSIYKIDRATGNILWKYGGLGDQFGLSARQLPQGQHFARISADGSLIYFDDNTYCEGIGGVVQWFLINHYCSSRDPNSRIVKVMLNEQNHTVTSFQEFRFMNSSNSYQINHNLYQKTGYMGSFQVLDDGNFLVGFGSRASAERDVIEVDPSNSTIFFELYFNFENQSPNQDMTYSYRAQFSN